MLAGVGFAASQAAAQTLPPPDQTGRAAQAAQDQEQRERAERQAEQRERQRTAPDVRLQARTSGDYRQLALPQESPCFHLKTLRLEGPRSDAFGFVQSYLDRYAGQCVGVQGLQLLAHRVSDLILARGYVTTRVAVPEQNLAQGNLRLLLVPGTLGAVRFAPGSAKVDWRSALPMRPGDLLNLRDIEQGLEQLKRVPSQDVKIDIAPGSAPDSSDLVLTVTRDKPWRVTFNLDDSGSNATGREQGGINLALDQPLGINDLFSAGVNHSVGGYRGEKGTHGANFNYGLPWGNWTFNLGSWNYGYRQPVTGSDTTFDFTGRSRTTSASATRLLHRDARSRTSIQFTINARQAHSYVNGVEIAVQRRQTRAAELALLHRRYLGNAQLDLRLAYRRGVPWFGGQWQAATPGGPTYRYGVTTLDASLSLPFQSLGQSWLWTSELRAQGTGDRLYVEDYLTIGGRYTVRGFDGEQTLGGAHGAYWRNTLALPMGSSGLALYGGLDMGRVGGAQVNEGAGNGLSSHSLSGAVVGLRGGRWNLNWDLFAGWALHEPRGVRTRRPAAGMQWIYTF
ncbi:ShlB/FhaC/HecB family hemolysin secretion/activation protein [Frateuria defendens]|uniref:ShlB/FhaC/HecB family hemolysin secretion/activation protein n=1 Tax=Frateuria defendens TaxID=2219559 RepID=UPI0007DBFFDC|nr:ShlB/FhaC/HecB family hemolysin secretion/activation protein [Frateuria defendens]